jgi:alkaline phosphatase D
MKHPNSDPSPVTDFLLFLGDFIYADVPLYIGDDQEAYRRLYRRNYQSPSFRNVYEKLRK